MNCENLEKMGKKGQEMKAFSEAAWILRKWTLRWAGRERVVRNALGISTVEVQGRKQGWQGRS